MTPGRQGGKSGGSLGLIIGIVAVALVIVGVGCWWYFGYRNSHPILTDDIDVEEVAEIHYPDASSSPSQTEPQQATSSNAAATPQTSASASSAAMGVGTGSEAASLFNRPLTYTESWMGQSSLIKDDLAHTLTFKRINTSAGQSMTASFALRQ